MNEARYREAERRLWTSLNVTPTEQRLDLERTGATVRVQEVGEGPPVVFVHGASNTGTSWAPLVAQLDGFRCILLDRPGCGLSARAATRFDDVERLGRFADSLVVDVLDAMGLDTAHVVGTSFGGYIVLRSAAAHPDRIERMVAFGFPIGARIVHTPLVMRLASVRGLGLMMTRVPPTKAMVRAMLRQIGLRRAVDSGSMSAEAIGWFLAVLRDTDTMRNELEAGPRILTPLRGLNDSLLLTPELLAQVSTPTYFLWGEEDPFGGADVARPFAQQLPNAELELMPGAGHAVWIDDPDHAAKVTRTFLSA
jgi:pimeloyl-ACP methyl ester carboxylesterase